MTIVATSYGDLAGAETGGIYSFKGIPYAAPIAGESRWLPPAPPKPWSGTRDATRFGAACP